MSSEAAKEHQRKINEIMVRHRLMPAEGGPHPDVAHAARELFGYGYFVALKERREYTEEMKRSPLGELKNIHEFVNSIGIHKADVLPPRTLMASPDLYEIFKKIGEA